MQHLIDLKFWTKDTAIYDPQWILGPLDWTTIRKKKYVINFLDGFINPLVPEFFFS